jgi:hypothetical protein
LQKGNDISHEVVTKLNDAYKKVNPDGFDKADASVPQPFRPSISK